MEPAENYSRKISSEEAKLGYIFILKNRLPFFAATGKPFTLCAHKKEKKVTVESYHCTCRGPQLPHDHYFIRWDGLRTGERITITKHKKLAAKYLLASKQ